MSFETGKVYYDELIEDECEAACAFCGPKSRVSWEVVLTDGERAYICYNDYQKLDKAELILGERRIGEMTWEECSELREFLNKQQNE